jgi:hypothetical protein
LREQDATAWTWLGWLRIGFHKMLWIAGLAQEPFRPPVELYSVRSGRCQLVATWRRSVVLASSRRDANRGNSKQQHS